MFGEQKIVARDRPATSYTYKVTGSNPFPFDMLRYDRAWPISSASAAYLDEQRGVRGQFTIELHSYNMPTVPRWKSFGWKVDADTEVL